MYAQFALVIAATALLSAINAATLKPTQCALWLRRPVPPEQRNVVYRAFNRVYDRAERGYTRLITRIVARAGVWVVATLIFIAFIGFMFTRMPTGFLPIEDQGYLIANVQLPDGASLERTQKALDRVQEIARKTPGVEQVVTIAGVSVLDGSATLSSAGVAYIILKDWGLRGRGQDLFSLFTGLNKEMDAIEEARIMVLPPPPIQGVGNAAGATMQIELRDGSFDLAKLQNIVDADGGERAVAVELSARARTVSIEHSAVRHRRRPREDADAGRDARSGVQCPRRLPWLGLCRSVQQIRPHVPDLCAGGLEVSACGPRTSICLPCATPPATMVPLGTLVSIKPVVGASLISLYNLYPSATIVALPARGVSSGQAMNLMEQIAAKTLPPGAGYSWTAMSYQEKIVGNQMFVVFGLGDSARLSRARGPVRELVHADLGDPRGAAGARRSGGRAAGRAARQQPLRPDRARAADRAVGQERHPDRGGARANCARTAATSWSRRSRRRAPRFRPILMTSFAFILGVAPLVVASGAGASARISIGITVFSGMIASTCLAVLLVPAFFVIVQRFEERLAARKKKPAVAAAPAE